MFSELTSMSQGRAHYRLRTGDASEKVGPKTPFTSRLPVTSAHFGGNAANALTEQTR